MGWQIPICQKERSSLKKVCLTAFAESEFGNPGIFVTAYFLVTKINRERWVDEDVNFSAERRPPVPVFG